MFAGPPDAPSPPPAAKQDGRHAMMRRIAIVVKTTGDKKQAFLRIFTTSIGNTSKEIGRELERQIHTNQGFLESSHHGLFEIWLQFSIACVELELGRG